ncbi:MAG: hypothetical protein ACFFCW_07135 [Candidatus Hodarchaeota archaeon]
MLKKVGIYMEQCPSVYTHPRLDSNLVSAVIWIRSGFKDCRESCPELAHLTEHLIIESLPESLPILKHAVCAMEYTYFQITSTKNQFQPCFSKLLNMLTNFQTSEEKFQTQKHVVLQEQRYRKTDLLQDFMHSFAMRYWNIFDSSLEKLELGIPTIETYISSKYHDLNKIIITASGSIAGEHLCKILEPYLYQISSDSVLNNSVKVHPVYNQVTIKTVKPHLLFVIPIPGYKNVSSLVLEAIHRILVYTLKKQCHKKGIIYAIPNKCLLYAKHGFIIGLLPQCYDYLDLAILFLKEAISRLIKTESYQSSKTLLQMIKLKKIAELESPTEAALGMARNMFYEQKIYSSNELSSFYDQLSGQKLNEYMVSTFRYFIESEYYIHVEPL